MKAHHSCPFTELYKAMVVEKTPAFPELCISFWGKGYGQENGKKKVVLLLCNIGSHEIT